MEIPTLACRTSSRDRFATCFRSGNVRLNHSAPFCGRHRLDYLQILQSADSLSCVGIGASSTKRGQFRDGGEFLARHQSPRLGRQA
jgi:hypothetical protein